jgi:hypothetical protein
VEPLVSVRVTGVPRRFSTSQLKRHFETFGPVSKIIHLPDRTWSSASSGVIQLLVQLRPGVVLPHFVNVVDPQGLLCERFAVYTEGRRRCCFRCGGTGHIGPFCKASCLGLGTEFRSEIIPRNRLGTVSVIPRKKVLIRSIPSSAEEPIPKLGTKWNGTEFREKMKFYGTV